MAGEPLTSGRVDVELPWWRRARGFIRRHRTLHLTWRLLVLLVGSAVFIAGLVMFITPGPGWLAVIAGLAILATEFTWAERLLNWAKQHAKTAADKALDPRSRQFSAVLIVIILVLAGLVAWWSFYVYGVPTPLVDAWDWLRGSS